MLEAVPLLAVTLLLVGSFASLVASVQLADVRAKWNERRCEPLVMLIAHLVPKTPEPNFAADNFSFCLREIIHESLGLFTGPMMGLFSQQVAATQPIANSMNTLRGTASSLFTPLNTLVGTLWNKFKFVLYQAVRIFSRVNSAIDRVFGIVLSSLFAGMSVFQGIQNTIGFVIQVCITILGILVALVIVLWFIMWPVIPIILTTIGILSATVYGANVSGMAGSFCVAPGTLVSTATGWRPVETLRPGDDLGDEGIVEGVLKTSGVGARCVALGTLVISETHLVFVAGEGWMFAGDMPGAVPHAAPAELYCLNTSSRTWMCEGGHLLRDWEELPATSSAALDNEWECMIYALLNPGYLRPHIPIGGRGLLGKETYVYTQRGRIPISEVMIGESVKDRGMWTRVVGVYHDISEEMPVEGPNEAMWVLEKGRWTHPCVIDGRSSSGYHLITESGTFTAYTSVLKYDVRDFTEIGADRIHETYEWTRKHILEHQ
jgi:uncharacterized membrane protein